MFLQNKKSNNKEALSNTLLSDKHTPFNNFQIGIWKETLLFLIGNALTLSIITTIVGTILLNMNEIDKKGAVTFLAYSILLVLLVTVLGSRIKSLLPKFINWAPYLVGLGIGLSIMIVNEVYLRFVNLFYDTGIGGNETGIRQVIERYPYASILIFGFVGPMCEELTYRMGTFNLIKRWHRIPAYIISALIFGFIHMDFQGNITSEFVLLPTYIFSGLALSFAYDMYDLPCSFTAHITNNLIVVIGQVIQLKS